MHIVVVGAGTTGTEIAQVFALGEHSITLHDTDSALLRASLGQISRAIDKRAAIKLIDSQVARRAKRVFTLTTDLERCARADFVIEAIPDDRDVKRKLLRALDALVRPKTILATTTNLHAVTDLAAATRTPERVIGLHFPKPAPLTGVVEVVQTPTTRRELIDDVADLIRSTERVPLVVDDAPGLVVNRIAQAYFGEALALLDDGNLDAKTVDRLMEAAGFARGPFRQMDYLGVDRVFAVTRAIFDATFYASPYRPHPRLARMAQAGLVGQRGERGGFYRDSDDES